MGQRGCPTTIHWLSEPCRLKLSVITRALRAKGNKMLISNETLKAMIRDYGGLELSDEELDLVRPELESYFAELQKLEDLDLSDIFSGRLMKLPD